MREKLLQLLTLFFLIGLTATSCSDDTPPKGSPGDQSFKLSYTIPAPTQVITRSVPTEEGEDQVNSFYILFFENTTGGTGKFIAAIDVMETHQGPLSNSGIVDVEFPVGSGLEASGTYNMLLCANIEAYQTGVTNLASLEAFCHGRTENEVIGLLQAKIEGVPTGLSPDAEQEDNTRRMILTNLPMSTSAVKQAGENELTVELIRTVSRFDVSLDQSVDGYELASASIWNAYTVSRVWEGVFSEFTDARTQRYYGVKVDDNKEIKGALYAFENFVSSPAQSDKVTTCLIIGLKNKNNNDKIEYFRANVNATGSIGHQLHRNHVYTLVIKGVTSEGDENERGAYGNSDFLLDIDINGWKVDDSGTIQVSGPDVLATPTSTARLFAQGETREYYVYTIGEGVPSITSRNLPGHIKATLKLAPGYSENSNFKASILTLEAAPGKTRDNNYKIEIGFSTMSAPITIEQVEGNIDFIDLDPYEVIDLGETKGSSTGEITVNSSGTWVAEIVQGDHLSFASSGSQIIKTEGAPGQGFEVFAHELNSADEVRYWFVSVYLKENPEIVRNLVIAQQGGADPRYVRFTADQINMSSTETYTYFSVQSDSPWEAEIIIEKGTKAGFNSAHTTQTYSATGNKSNIPIYIPLYYGNGPSRIIVKATVVGSVNSSELLITQPAYFNGALVLSNATGISNLAANTSTNYTYYVYNLGENMRNTSLFGPGGTFVDMPEDGFDFKTSTAVDAMENASIIQLVSTSEFNNAYTKYQEDPSKLLIFSHNNYSTTNSLLTSFRNKQTTGYTANSIVSAANAAANFREFYQGDNMEHPLIKYLLNGPAGEVNPDEVQLQGNSTTAGGIKEGNWPSTFVPIIKSVVNQNTFCVFGIDPIHRLIFIMDPAIFGATSTVSYLNRNNYVESDEEKTSNINLLNNFIAWMAEVATKGESFLEQFQVEVE